MGHERFWTTQRGRKLTDLGGFNKALSGLKPTGKVNGEQTSAVAQLLLRKCKLRVRSQAWVAHLGHGILCLEQNRKALSSGRLLT